MMSAGRNDPCPCGSGEKYKKCCLQKSAPSADELKWQRQHRSRNELIYIILDHIGKVYGPMAIEEAWDEFHQWQNEEGFDSESAEIQLFMPWFYYDWTPDEAGSDVFETAPRGISPARSLLQSKSSKLDSLQREYIELCDFTGFSFHEIVEAWPGKGFKSKDLLTGQFDEIIEKRGSEGARAGNIVFGKTLTMQGLTTLEACSTIMIPPVHKIEIIELRNKMEGQNPVIDRTVLWEYDPEIQTVYQKIYQSVMNPPKPILHNTDGDLLVPHKLTYDLLVDADAALRALANLNSQESFDEIIASAKKDDGKVTSVEFPWSKEGNSRHAGWKNTILGHIRIDGQVMTVDVNSQKRAKKFESLLSKRLPGNYKLRHKVIESLERAFEKRSPRSEKDQAEHEALQALPEVQEHLAKMMKAHWAGWIKSKIPALGDLTPIQAVKTKDGREAVDALLTQFELEIEKRAQPGVTLAPGFRKDVVRAEPEIFGGRV